MGFFSFFKFGTTRRHANRNAAAVARERLQIVVSHNTKQKDPDFLQKLHHELVQVISKYVHIDEKQIQVQLKETGERSVLELNVTLPQAGEAEETAVEKTPEAAMA